MTRVLRVASVLTAHCVALSWGRGLPSLCENGTPAPLPDVQGPERSRRAGVEAAEKVQLPSEQSWFEAASRTAMWSTGGTGSAVRAVLRINCVIYWRQVQVGIWELWGTCVKYAGAANV